MKRPWHAILPPAVLLLAAAALAGALQAQEPSAPMPASAGAGQNPQSPADATIRVNTNIVLVPTLVEKRSGEVVYGLGPKDFIVEDNGIPQKVQVDDDLDAQPVSLVVAVERGRAAALEFDKFARLGSLLELFLGQGHGEAALVVFDSKPVYLEGFTTNTDRITRHLRNLEPGDGGAAILDTVGYAVDLLATRPSDHRRILLLIGESRDHGSRMVSAKEVVARIGSSNTLVISLTYSPSKAQLLADLRGSARGEPSGNTADLLAPLMMAVAAVHKNVARELATMSGGEYTTFTREKGLEERVSEVASHARNRYILSFRPTDLTPGLHRLSVGLTADYSAQVVARTNYWAGPLSSTATGK